MAPASSALMTAVPAYYALILRSLTVLEGLALYADPNFKVLAASYPYLQKGFSQIQTHISEMLLLSCFLRMVNSGMYLLMS